MAFPTTPLAVRVELQLAGAWSDITPDVRLGERIHIERGRHDEGSRADPATCTMTLDNRGGRYSPRNAAGALYGLIGRNTPIRVRVPRLSSYLDVPAAAGARATTPDDPALRITGDLDIRVELEQRTVLTDDAHHQIISRYLTAGDQRSWVLYIINGYPGLNWSPDGTVGAVRAAVATAPVQPTPDGRIAVRVTLDVDDGTGGHTATFWSAPSLSGPWTQLGGPVTNTGTTSVHPGTATLDIGDQPQLSLRAAPMRVLRAEIRGGIGGPPVAAPDFTVQPPGTVAFTDPAGRTWTTTGGATITDLTDRFTGEVSSWTPRRDVSGKDLVVHLQAAGPARRLGQGAAPLQSTLRRSIPTGLPLAYWPMEDERGATQSASPIPGVGPLDTTGLDYGANTDLTGSAPLPTVRAGARLHGTVPPPAIPPTTWRVHLLYQLDTFPTTTSRLLAWSSTGTVRTWVLDAGALDGTVVHFYGLDADGGTVFDSLTVPVQFTGPGWHQLFVTAFQTGSSVTWNLVWYPVGGTDSTSSGSYPGTLGTPTQIDAQIGDALAGMSLGHLAVFDTTADVYNHADNGYEGDRPSQRIERLCAEEGVPVQLRGDIDSEVAMGPQRPGALLALLQEAADSDGGVLAERLDALSLWYRAGHTAYNQPPKLLLDYAGGDVAPPLEPADDDQAVRNDITVTRAGGSSARALDTTSSMGTQPPPAGVGRYDEGVTRSLWRDAQLPDIAGWLLHLGTWDGTRFPQVHLDLAASPRLIPAVLALDLRDRIDITGMPPEDGPTTVALLFEGYSENIGVYDWDITANCAPAGPWQVAVLADPDQGRADTAGTRLAAAATPTATLLLLTTTTGPAWTTDLVDLPLDLAVAGEHVRVLDLIGARGDRFERAVTGGWGTATSGQAWTTTGGTAADYAVQGG
ncbi:hypothetical protein ACIQOW_08395 [Kitasatospora sp. NPDC091335]|uniref:hypothetical protein n=1 Tax=Kitasatospora sp. NPDC091335 TaxID=3364085 RepID=UPI0037FF954D